MAIIDKDSLIVDRVRAISVQNYSTHEAIMRLSSVRDVTISTSAESQDITDAVGALITRMYRAKTAEISGTAALFSLGLAATQFGSDKEFGAEDKKIVVPGAEILTVENKKVTLPKTPVNDSVNYIYEVSGMNIGKSYRPSATSNATETEFVVKGKDITVPTTIEDGAQIYVEYEYEEKEAVKVSNMAEKFPTAVRLIADVVFRDGCSEELLAGKIVFPKAKVSAESVEISMDASNGHAFSYQVLKDYCANNDETPLFYIVVSE